VSTLFTINYRRAEFAKQLAGSRRRVVTLGVWVAYFGLLGILLGLYGLNGLALAGRLEVMERQTQRLRGAMESDPTWKVDGNDLTEVELRMKNGQAWASRLDRVSALMPSNAHLKSLAVNPQNLSTADARSLMEIAGELRAPTDTERLSSVMGLVSTLRGDSAFSASYHNISLASTRLTDMPGGIEFVIQCR